MFPERSNSSGTRSVSRAGLTCQSGVFFKGLTMAATIHSASLKSPLLYRQPDGRSADIPPGPCLVESLAGGLTIVVWGDEAEFSAVVATRS